MCVCMFVCMLVLFNNLRNYCSISIRFILIDYKKNNESELGEKIEKNERGGIFRKKNPTFCFANVRDIIKNNFLRCEPWVYWRKKKNHCTGLLLETVYFFHISSLCIGNFPTFFKGSSEEIDFFSFCYVLTGYKSMCVNLPGPKTLFLDRYYFHPITCPDNRQAPFDDGVTRCGKTHTLLI